MKFSTNPNGVQLEIVLADIKKEKAMDVNSLLANLPPLKLLVEFDADYRAYVAYSLDTGAVATGDTVDEAQSLIKRILENDIGIAQRTKNLKSLLHTRAPVDVQIRWLEAKTASPENVQWIELRIPSSDEGVQPKRGVQTELRIGRKSPVA
jgi:hypothetical protein